MKDVFWKLWVLWKWGPTLLSDWYHQVWLLEDIDGYVCCSGRSITSPCGCQGITHRQEIEYWLKKYEH